MSVIAAKGGLGGAVVLARIPRQVIAGIVSFVVLGPSAGALGLALTADDPSGLPLAFLALWLALTVIFLPIVPLEWVKLNEERIELSPWGVVVASGFRVRARIPWSAVLGISQRSWFGSTRLRVWTAAGPVEVSSPTKGRGPWSDRGFDAKAALVMDMRRAYGQPPPPRPGSWSSSQPIGP